MLDYWGKFDSSNAIVYSYNCHIYVMCHNLFNKTYRIWYNSVENRCKTLRKNLRLCCEYICVILRKSRFYVIKLWKSRVLHRTVEKFCLQFSSTVYLYKIPVLHTFHIAYYNNYCLFNNKEVYEN